MRSAVRLGLHREGATNPRHTCMGQSKTLEKPIGENGDIFNLLFARNTAKLTGHSHPLPSPKISLVHPRWRRLSAAPSYDYLVRRYEKLPEGRSIPTE